MKFGSGQNNAQGGIKKCKIVTTIERIGLTTQTTKQETTQETTREVKQGTT
jgi:hypothetical protein